MTELHIGKFEKRALSEWVKKKIVHQVNDDK